MDTEKLSEQESLTIISNMINKAKGEFSENGHLYLLWGWVILICVATAVAFDYQLLLLGVAVIVAWIIPGYILRARYKKVNF